MALISNPNSSRKFSPKHGLGRFPGAVDLRHRIATFRTGEDGSVTPFSLFIFMMMLFAAGMGVDLMRFETSRAALQNTLDSATLAATNLRSDADATALVNEFMAKRGYDTSLLSVNVQETHTGNDPVTGAPGTLVARSVSADYDLALNTIFMPLLGIDHIGTTAAGGAKEGQTTVEISLVLDISGSMGGQKIDDLKVAAKNFVNQVIDPTRTDLPVTISIVPFNHTVVVPDAILDQLNSNAPVTISPANVAPYSWGNPLQQYDREADGSKCVRFMDNELLTNDLQVNAASGTPNYRTMRAITTTQTLNRMAYYNPGDKSGGPGGAYSRPGDGGNRRCDPTRSAILPYATNITVLENYIDGLSAGGWTSNDTGLKWGVALLDPAFRPVVTGMVANNLLPTEVNGRPFNYDPTNFQKVVVLMTDGANTTQYDLAGSKKKGPSRVWFSQTAMNETGNWYDGYFLEMPANAATQRWLRVRAPSNFTDGALYGNGAMASNYADLTQMSYTELYDRFSVNALADLVRDDVKGLATDYTDHRNAEQVVQDTVSANRRMSGSPTDSTIDYGICDATKVNNDILVYTIAFQAGTTAETVMQDCATSPGYYFKASNKAALVQAFATIATSITSLRLTQ